MQSIEKISEQISLDDRKPKTLCIELQKSTRIGYDSEAESDVESVLGMYYISESESGQESDAEAVVKPKSSDYPKEQMFAKEISKHEASIKDSKQKSELLSIQLSESQKRLEKIVAERQVKDKQFQALSYERSTLDACILSHYANITRKSAEIGKEQEMINVLTMEIQDITAKSQVLKSKLPILAKGVEERGKDYHDWGRDHEMIILNTEDLVRSLYVLLA